MLIIIQILTLPVYAFLNAAIDEKVQFPEMNTWKIKKALQPAQQECTSNFSNSFGMKRNTDGVMHQHLDIAVHCHLVICRMTNVRSVWFKFRTIQTAQQCGKLMH